MTDQHTSKYIEKLNSQFADSDPHDILTYFLNKYKDKIAFSSSMGLEDQIITHMIMSINKNASIFTLDTGRLFQETYDLIEKTNSRYSINIKIMYPDTIEVEEMVNKKGINLFYESIENRKLCCNIRKINPLSRALYGQDVWITGLRSEQSVTRKGNQLIEWEEDYNLIKLNPLIKWTEKEVTDYIDKNSIPYNTLHDKGFPSIGCQPCTKAIQQGDDIRAGRWWWENPELKECGLHNNNEG